MDQQQGQPGVPGPAGRRLHIAHRRSPSELTPLMMEQLAIQQQIELLQQQQQQIQATHQQYVNMGMIQPQQQLPALNAFAPVQGQVSGLSAHPGAFQFPQLSQQQLAVPLNAPTQPSSHRRNQSALPSMNMGGPPPAPSAGASGSIYSDYNQSGNTGGQNRESMSQRGGRGPPGGGHQRRHSLALPEAKKAAELAQQKRTTSGFQFPIPGAGGATSSSSDRSASPSTTEDKSAQGQQQSHGNHISSGSLSARSGNRMVSHGRSQSMAVGNGRSSMQGRGAGGFQFPSPLSQDASSEHSDFQRRSSGHGRTASRNFEGNWRQPNNNQNQAPEPQPPMGSFSQPQTASSSVFQPGHRTRASIAGQSIGSLGSFQFPAQPQLLQLPQGQVVLGQPQLFAGQQLNPLQLGQLQALQAAQLTGQQVPGLQSSQHSQSQLSQQQAQQQRKTLFTPYLPQASLPALLSDGQLVAGVLRVNKKNRSDAYVTTPDLDADIFICGSKDRNRALVDDLVAVELLDVDEVWSQKREKEEKKRRKDVSESRSGGDKPGRSDSLSADGQSAMDGGIKRRGSLRQRPTQKKNDDVEVEGQSLLLMEEEEVNDEQKPLYAGHVVAVIERIAGQMFSGTLGLLRPSSQATKEKQEAERQAREGSGRSAPDRHQEKPKIVWFKPTDKRVPLIAIPTEQAPRDFVEKHQEYANRIFVACIKRWPITSLHPFGTLVEQLGEMGNLKVETDALLRDNNFGPDEFAEAVLKDVGHENWSVAAEDESVVSARKDLREEKTFTIDPNGAQQLDNAIHVKTLGDGRVEIGVHVADVAHFIKRNSLVDREAKKRGTGVYLVNRAVSMLPPRLASDLCSLSPGQERFTVSVIFKADPRTGHVFEDETWVGKSIIKSSGKLSYDEVDAVLTDSSSVSLDQTAVNDVKLLYGLTRKFREARFGSRSDDIPPLRLLYQLDDENVPVEQNVFDATPSHELIEELSHKANAFVAKKLAAALPGKAFLRRQAAPNSRRLQTFAERMTNIGYDIDTSSSGSIQASLFNVEDQSIRKGMETLLVKTMSRAKYFVAGKLSEQQYAHFALNLPLYTHFTNPTRRYADIVVHRQLEAILSNAAIEIADDIESLVKIAEHCNNKKDSAQIAQEQSVHIESCRALDRKRQQLGGDLTSEGIVISVYESAFDVLIPEYGFEKRVHCDQLPLKKAEFDKHKRILELYWEKDIPSSAYIPEDERPPAGSVRGSNAAAAAAAAREAEAAKKRAKENEEAQRKQMDTGTMSTDDVDALFDDDEDVASEITEMAAGVSLNPTAGSERPTQSMPPSPTRTTASSEQGPHRTRSDPKLASSATEAPEGKLTDKEKYMKLFALRQENGEYIQDVREMTRVPIILKTDLSKSPPCLTIRSVNPYAL
ncbi:RNB-domain-containing protein [Xylona heveae TC161]|uniref:RNB-domain-containing protein n=1 Tax=Xylona heveae (strain CBS 132557 / TC161) TaxID=1328760 RepID=A0A165JPD3_XYLHT|nr:RNB-domain-containing protein [Xylona heveae TC161]KZF26478.1 RNB-domain-containing protein [Xylona heveae TC161]